MFFLRKSKVPKNLFVLTVDVFQKFVFYFLQQLECNLRSPITDYEWHEKMYLNENKI